MTENKYEDHIGLIVKILGRDACSDGEGVEPFLKAIKTYDSKKCKFSTWLYHNLWMHKLRLNEKNRKRTSRPREFVDAGNCEQFLLYELDPQREIELLSSISNLPDDSKIIVKFVLSNNLPETKTRRSRWKVPPISTRAEIRSQIMDHFHSKGWGKKRILKAFREIKKMLMELYD